MKRLVLVVASGIFATTAHSQIAATQSHRADERFEQLQKSMVSEEVVSLVKKEPKKRYQSLPEESACFSLGEIVLVEDPDVRSFQGELNTLLSAIDFTAGDCLGGLGINQIMTELQNIIIGQGYTTTRVLAPAQDLTTGVLELKILAGRVKQIKMTEESEPYARVLSNAFPINSGEMLNLHQIEQGLENLKRVPSANASMEIVPTDKVDESDIVVAWEQAPIPYRFSISADDSGSKSTGKYQTNLTFSADNPLGLNDLFYASLTRNLGKQVERRFSDYERGGDGTRGYALHYSIPYGRWRFSINKNRHQYDQLVAGINGDYSYNGSSNNLDASVTYLLYRDASRKTETTLSYWARSSRNYINDAEIDVQRRKMGGWKLGITHREYIGNSVLDFGLEYKRGTGANSSLRAPEELFGEGTSRPKILTGSVGINIPFRLGDQLLSYSGYGRFQYNFTRLISQDMFSIGSRYSVRGFDGEVTLMAERGWFYQNTLSWAYKPAHQFYLALDIGRISGPNAKYNVGTTLIGAGIGIRGQFANYGRLNYDLFAGTPIYKPKNFRTSNKNLNVSFTYSF